MTTIHHLPKELIDLIFQFLGHEELDACFKVCQRWMSILNKNTIWRKCCIYPEKYFIKNNKFNLGSEPSPGNDNELCKWRRYYEHQQLIYKNWSGGRFVMVQTDIDAEMLGNSVGFVDYHGNHWLLTSSNVGLQVWNITNIAVLHCDNRQVDHIGMCTVKDKLVFFRSDYIKVFRFMYPDYNITPEYRFIANMSAIMPADEIISDDYYSSFVRFIIVDRFFVGYTQNITNIHTAFLHIWDLESAKKVATQSTFQQTFADFVRSSSGSDITRNFEGALLLFEGDSGRFLVTLIHDINDICQISLFSLHTMMFVNVVAQLDSKRAWCFMKGDIIVIWHSNRYGVSKVSIYNVSGEVLSTLDLLHNYNPYFKEEFWFDTSKVIVKLKEKIHIFNVVTSQEVHKKILEVEKRDYIVCYFEPKFLLLHNKHMGEEDHTISVWDIHSGVKLWELKSIQKCYGLLLKGSEYPGKLFVRLTGSDKVSILDFGECVT